jgi:tetratricopeptide (TPR) repeat protein
MAGPLQLALPAVSRDGWVDARVEAVAPFVVAAAASGLLAIDQGGYQATTWGWAALALAWVGGIALVLREGRVSRLELSWIGGLTALTGWTAASMLWTSSQTETALEVERTFVYLLAAIAVAAVARSFAYRGILWGTWVGTTVACLYALATRLFPERLGTTDPVAGSRLFEPIGYWNGLGLLTAVAILLAAGLATHGRPGWARGVAAAFVPLLLPTLYFTFSRGAWIALAAALIAAFALSDRRLQLASSLLLQALSAAAALWLAYRAKPLRETTGTLTAAAHAGHTLAWRLLLLAAGAAAMRIAYDAASRRVQIRTHARRGFAVVLLACLVAVVAGALVHYGGPAGAFDRARRSIDSNPTGGRVDLNQRLFSLSSNGRLQAWHVALDEWHAHPLLGGGAGSFAEYWAAAGPNQTQLVEVHNLYLETLAELGPIGLALLAATLLVPLAAAVRARHHSLVPIAAAGYVAWLVHVGYDWDWELPGVTIAAILCGGALLVAARRQGAIVPRAPARWGLLATACIAGVAAFFGLLGSRDLSRSVDALHTADYAAAVSAAHSARRWEPWSSAPWAQLALIRRLQGDKRGEQAAYERAVAKDPRDWELWLGLVSVSHGTEYRHALQRLSLLSPAAAAGVRGRP